MKQLLEIDQDRRKEYGRLKRNRVIKVITITLIIWLVITIMNISMHTDLESDVLFIILLSTLFSYGLIVGIIALIGAKDMYDMMSLEVTDKGIIRHGALFHETSIAFNEIDSVIVDSTGFLVIRKGFGNKFLFKYLKIFLNTSRSNNLIYVPSKLSRYDELKEKMIQLT